MTKRERIAFNKSYHAYKRDWYNWKNKGWSMKGDAPLSKEKYLDKYVLAKDANLKNISRELASADRAVDTKEAKELQKVLGNIPKGTDISFDRDLEKKFNSLRNIKKNIGAYATDIDGIKYSGKQALYLDIKFIYGISKANEYYGY